jgi:hypothetical protein
MFPTEPVPVFIVILFFPLVLGLTKFSNVNDFMEIREEIHKSLAFLLERHREAVPLVHFFKRCAWAQIPVEEKLDAMVRSDIDIRLKDSTQHSSVLDDYCVVTFAPLPLFGLLIAVQEQHPGIS